MLDRRAHDRCDTEYEECRKGGIQESRDSRKWVFVKGGMLESRDSKK